MEVVTGFTAKEVLGMAPFEAYGFYRCIYVRQAYFYYMKNAPLPRYVSARRKFTVSNVAILLYMPNCPLTSLYAADAGQRRRTVIRACSLWSARMAQC